MYYLNNIDHSVFSYENSEQATGLRILIYYAYRRIRIRTVCGNRYAYGYAYAGIRRNS